MMAPWSQKSIRFMEDALKRSNYFEKLCKIIVPYLEGCKTVCDAGCGLGHLAAELGRLGFEAVAADSSEQAISYVKSKGFANVKPLECDLLSYTPQTPFDAMVFHYFGSIEQILSIGKAMCRGPLIVIKKNYENHRFSISENPLTGYTAKSAEQQLSERGIGYEKILFDCEMGQPFRSLEDAKEFFEIYSSDSDRSLLSLENIEKRLERTNDPLFPYYLPKSKPSAIFIIR